MQLFFFIIFSLIFTSTVQSEDYNKIDALKSNSDLIQVFENKISFKSNSLKIDENNNTITLLGNVEVDFEHFFPYLGSCEYRINTAQLLSKHAPSSSTTKPLDKTFSCGIPTLCRRLNISNVCHRR